MLTIPPILTKLYGASNVRDLINQRLTNQGLPVIGPAYRVCPAPRTSLSFTGIKVTIYLQYLDERKEVAITIPVLSANKPDTYTLDVKAANPSCLG